MTTQEGNPNPADPTVTQDGGTDKVQFSPEQANALLNGSQEGQQGEAPAEDGPPEGFASWEEYGKAQAAKAKEASAPEGEAEPEEDPLVAAQKAEAEKALKELPEAVREQAAPLFNEYATTGNLSEESIKEAAKVFNVTEDMVRQYVKGAQVDDAAGAAAILQEAGVSQEDHQAFQAWARDGGYTDAQRLEFDASLAKDPAGTVKAAIAAWKEAGNGPAPRDITKSERPAPAADQQGPLPFQSVQQMVAAMNDPKYGKDPAYTKEVELRVQASELGTVSHSG